VVWAGCGDRHFFGERFSSSSGQERRGSYKGREEVGVAVWGYVCILGWEGERGSCPSLDEGPLVAVEAGESMTGRDEDVRGDGEGCR
jgi:hypothetical protein